MAELSFGSQTCVAPGCRRPASQSGGGCCWLHHFRAGEAINVLPSRHSPAHPRCQVIGCDRYAAESSDFCRPHQCRDCATNPALINGLCDRCAQCRVPGCPQELTVGKDFCKDHLHLGKFDSAGVRQECGQSCLWCKVVGCRADKWGHNYCKERVTDLCAEWPGGRSGRSGKCPQCNVGRHFEQLPPDAEYCSEHRCVSCFGGPAVRDGRCLGCTRCIIPGCLQKALFASQHCAEHHSQASTSMIRGDGWFAGSRCAVPACERAPTNGSAYCDAHFHQSRPKIGGDPELTKSLFGNRKLRFQSEQFLLEVPKCFDDKVPRESVIGGEAWRCQAEGCLRELHDGSGFCREHQCRSCFRGPAFRSGLCFRCGWCQVDGCPHAPVDEKGYCAQHLGAGRILRDGRLAAGLAYGPS